jgi:thiol-disulfide isomerase/thioredoxin
VIRWLLISMVCGGSARAEEALAMVDQVPPSFRLPLYNPQSMADAKFPLLGLSYFTGSDAADKATRLVIVSFMASFCAPCKKEIPYLQSLYERHREQGLRILLVAIDQDEAGQKKVDELITSNKVTFPVLKDRFNIVARRWLGSQSPLPSLFVVRPDGTVKAIHRGYSEDASVLLDREVRALLAASK